MWHISSFPFCFSLLWMSLKFQVQWILLNKLLYSSKSPMRFCEFLYISRFNRCCECIYSSSVDFLNVVTVPPWLFYEYISVHVSMDSESLYTISMNFCECIDSMHMVSVWISIQYPHRFFVNLFTVSLCFQWALLICIYIHGLPCRIPLHCALSYSISMNFLWNELL